MPYTIKAIENVNIGFKTSIILHIVNRVLTLLLHNAII